MKFFSRIVLLFALVLHSYSGHAQEQEQSTNSSLTLSGGGLQIDTRTEAERIEFLMKVASVYIEEDDFVSAVGAYERILEIDPQNREASFVLSHVYINAKQYAKAEAKLLELIEQYPDDFQLKNNLAWLYATAEDPAFRNGKKSIQLAQEAMAIAPNDHHVWSTLSEAYYVTGDYEKAYRAIKHMAWLATSYGMQMSKEMVDEYNEQIMKCRRALDTEKALKGEDESDEETAEDAPGND